jgi:hypothetical protein
MQGGKRKGAGRKKKAPHLRRELLTLRLPQWMIWQLKDKGEIGCVLESFLVSGDFLDPPKDYK